MIDERSSSTDNNSIDWNSLASDILSFNAYNICTQYYQVGSGSVKQTIPVNRTCRCIVFDKLFNSSTNLRQFATFLRPLLYGKIYYYPSNSYYYNLIQQINQTFESLDELIKLFREIQSNIQPTYQILSSFCDSISNASTICDQLYSSTTYLSYFVIFTEFIACTERNRFVAKISESQLVQDGQNNSLTNTFLAGIVFLDNITDNSGLPKHVRYKIRMALDYVDNTFQNQDK